MKLLGINCSPNDEEGLKTARNLGARIARTIGLVSQGGGAR